MLHLLISGTRVVDIRPGCCVDVTWRSGLLPFEEFYGDGVRGEVKSQKKYRTFDF